MARSPSVRIYLTRPRLPLHFRDPVRYARGVRGWWFAHHFPLTNGAPIATLDRRLQQAAEEDRNMDSDYNSPVYWVGVPHQLNGAGPPGRKFHPLPGTPLRFRCTPCVVVEEVALFEVGALHNGECVREHIAAA